MKSESEIRQTLATLLRTLSTVGLEPHSRHALKAAIGTLQYVLGEENPYFSIERTLNECAELLAPLDEPAPVGA